MNISHTVFPDSGYSNYNDWMNYVSFQNYIAKHRDRVRELTQLEIQNLKK